MDIFLLLPSCGWCVNHFLSYFYFSVALFFNFTACDFKFLFSFSWVASLCIRMILLLVISNLSIIGYTEGCPNSWIAYCLSCKQSGPNRKP